MATPEGRYNAARKTISAQIDYEKQMRHTRYFLFIRLAF